MATKNTKQAVLIVLDGWGYREDTRDNAIAQAHTPNFKKYWNKYPHTLLQASGLSVGLPHGQVGNSEIGHTTIGAGTVMDTDLVRIGKAVKSGDYAKNPAFQKLWKHVLDNDSTLHIQGLLGDGGVHSHSEHLFAFLRASKSAGIKRIAIHIFTDGRDTPPQSAGKYIADLEKVLDEINDKSPIAFIATISGRFYAMDRDNNWDRLSKTEQAMFECKGHICELKRYNKASNFVTSLYKDGKLDEHLEPIICKDYSGKTCAVGDNDGIFFFNFRADRARMISQKIIERSARQNLCFVTLTEYSSTFQCLVAFPPIKIETTLAKEISLSGMTQTHIAETEKFPHATYFLNGGVEKPYKNEKHILLDSRKDIPTHDLAPKMRAEAIADKAIEEINDGTNFIFINFANPDMVGHTANVPAIIEAVEETDKQLGRVITAIEMRGGTAFITADHGNAEVNIDPETGAKHTAHTLNLVPAIITKDEIELKKEGSLIDITPTILKLLGIDKPKVMTGQSLIV